GVITELSNLALKTKGIQDAFAVSGFSILTRSNSSAAGLLFLRLKPFGQRAGISGMTADAIAHTVGRQFSKVEGGHAVVLLPPAVRGIGNAGGFTMQVEDRSGSATPQQLQAATQHLIDAAHSRPELSRLLSTFRA